MDTRLKELFSNTLILTIANFSSKILVFLMVPLYTTVLTTEEYGISDMINVIGALLLPIATLSISNAVLRFCFVKEYDQNEVLTIGWRIILIGTVSTIIVTAVLYWFNIFPQLGLFLWFVPFYFLLNALSTLLTNFSQGIEKVKLSAISGVASTITIVLFNLLFLLVFKFGIIGYIISFLLGALVSSLIIIFKLSVFKRIKPVTSKVLRKQMISFSAPLVPNDLSWWALDSFNRFFILSTLSVSAVGIYSASARIPAILTALCSIFTQAWLLSALKDYGTKESINFIQSIHGKLFSLLVIITALFILASKPLALLLLSGDFSSCWNLIPFLMVSVFMGAMAGFLGSIYAAEKKNSMQFVSTLLGAIISIIIMLLFLRTSGIAMAAISNMAGYIVIWLVRKLGVNKFIDIGKSTINCIIQLAFLIGESMCIYYSLWIPAILLTGILFIINSKDVIYAVLFFKNIITSKILNK